MILVSFSSLIQRERHLISSIETLCLFTCHVYRFEKFSLSPILK